MKHALAGLLVLALLENIFAEVSGQSRDGSKKAPGSSSSSLHLIQEPGVGTPGENEKFTAVKTDGCLQAAREKAMDDVRFEARNKGLNYEIFGMTEERLGFGYRVKIQYRLRPLVMEVATPETIWWQELLKKIQGYLPYLKKVLAEADRFVNSSLSKNQKTETPTETEITP